MFLIFYSAETKFWFSLVFLFVAGVGYVGYKLTRGFIGGYLYTGIGDSLKGGLLIMHGLASLLLALILPNNFLVEIEMFHTLYEESELWIAASMVILLFLFLLGIGSLLTIVTKRISDRSPDSSKEYPDARNE